MNYFYYIQPSSGLLKEKYFGIFYLGYHLKISIRRILYFIKHLARCKRNEDKIRLVLLYSAESVYASVIINKLAETLKEVIDLAFPKPIYVEQKLLNA